MPIQCRPHKKKTRQMTVECSDGALCRMRSCRHPFHRAGIVILGKVVIFHGRVKALTGFNGRVKHPTGYRRKGDIPADRPALPGRSTVFYPINEASALS